MNQQPDKLFREKLEGFSKPVSANAWSKVEAGMDKKNSKGLLLKIAAAIVLLTVAAVFLLSKRSMEDQPKLAQKTSDKKIEAPYKKEDSIPSVAAVTVEKKSKTNTNPGTTVKTTIKKQKNIKAETREEVATAEVTITEMQQEKAADILPEAPPEEINTSAPETYVVQNEQEDEGVHLVYSAEEVNKKYLDKKSITEATSSEKKPSTLKKLLDKAYDLKHNQDPFGDLRQKKNEILALNFKNEKQRSQNK